MSRENGRQCSWKGGSVVRLSREMLENMDGRAHILVVDAEKVECDELRYLLEGEGYEVDQALCGADALSKIEQEEFDLILAQISMPGTDGLDMLRHIREADQEVVEIVMGDHFALEAAIEAWRYDVSGYVPQPLDDPDRVLAAVASGLADRRELKDRNS
jgi:DNA-binding NtrC family response regulator